MKPITYVLIALFSLGLIALFVEPQGTLWNTLQHYIENKELVTLEARFTPNQLLETHQKEFTDRAKHPLEPELRFAPYLLLEVKWRTSKGQTKESSILWSLIDGEMVLDTSSWEKTHGFQDAIHSDASAQDFLILNTLARTGGPLSIDQLQKELQVEPDKLTPMIASAKRKHLIFQQGNALALHFQHPNFHVRPETFIQDWLVTKPYEEIQKFPRKFTPSQINRIAHAAFGSDFSIRSTTEIYLPIYQLQLENPDGTHLTTFWNALTGQQIVPSYGIPNL